MDTVKQFNDVLYYLPKNLSRLLAELPEEIKAQTYEIRLRAGKPLVLCGAFGSAFPMAKGRYSCMSYEKTPVVTPSEVEGVVSALCGGSIYAHQDEINQGFLSFPGGGRAGVAGIAVRDGGQIKSVRGIGSVNIRIAKNIDGAGQEIYESIFTSGLNNVLLFGAPMTGKTTVLKDLAARLSTSPTFYRTVIVDERCEMRGCGGVHLDVFCGYPKAQGIQMATRSFSPELIVCDELGGDAECDAVLSAMDCGVKFLLSVHCGSREELLRRPIGRRLIASGSFDWFVHLKGIGEKAAYYTREVLYAEMDGSHPDFKRIGAGGDVLQFQNDKANITA